MSGELINGHADVSLPVSSKRGWLLVGHGTRDAQGRREFLSTAIAVANQATVPVEACFLELAEPSIPGGMAKLRDRGCEEVVVVPLLLFSAGHAKNDVPDETAAAAAACGLKIMGQAPALGLHPSLLGVSRKRVRSAVSSGGTTPQRTALVAIGRGSSDEQSTEQMRDYVGQVAKSLQIDRLSIGFVAVATPTMTDVLVAVAKSDADAVVVWPHLLFQGDVLASIRRAVIDARSLSPRKNWVVAAHVGPVAELVEAICQRAREVASS